MRPSFRLITLVRTPVAAAAITLAASCAEPMRLEDARSSDAVSDASSADVTDAAIDGRFDATNEAAIDSPIDSPDDAAIDGSIDSPGAEAGVDAAPIDAATDAQADVDSDSADASPDTSAEAAVDAAATDATSDALADVGPDSDDASADAASDVPADADSSPPTVTSISASSPDATISTVPWFDQRGGDIDVVAVIVDGGSAIDVTTLRLMTGGTQLDHGATADANVTTNHAYHFAVARVNAVVSSGSEQLLTVRVTGADGLGRAVTGVTGEIGIDGHAPAVTFALSTQYPASNANCDTSQGTDSSGASISSTSIVCGHDGAHFIRSAADTTMLVYSANDALGAGVDLRHDASNRALTATCAIPGAACSVQVNASAFGFAFDPAAATFSSGSDGTGTVHLGVTASDLVGNQSSAAADVQVTRVRWIRALPAGVGALTSAPVITPPIGGVPQVLVAGSGTGDTIVSLNLDGGLQRTQRAVTGVISITGDIAYSPRSNLLYAAPEGGTAVSAFAVTASSPFLAPSFMCSLGATARVTGSPAIAGVATDRVIVADVGANKLWALAGSAGACDVFRTTSVSVGTGTLGSPTTNGATIDVPYYNSSSDHGVARVPFGSDTFGTPSLVRVAGGSVFRQVALTSTATFFGDALNPGTCHSFSTDFATNLWSGFGTGAMRATLTAAPVVYGGFVYGSAGAGDGFLRAFNVTDGNAAFTYPAGTGLGSLSAVGVGRDGVVYVTDARSGALHAISAPAAGTFATLAAGWSAPFLGPSGSFLGSGATTEATIGADGTLYLGTSDGRLFAVMTDSVSGVPPTDSSWPRVRFDNCNQGNLSLTNCP